MSISTISILIKIQFQYEESVLEVGTTICYSIPEI